MESIRSEGLMAERHEIVSTIGTEEKIESGNKSADSIGMKGSQNVIFGSCEGTNGRSGTTIVILCCAYWEHRAECHACA